MAYLHLVQDSRPGENKGSEESAKNFREENLALLNSFALQLQVLPTCSRATVQHMGQKRLDTEPQPH